MAHSDEAQEITKGDLYTHYMDYVAATPEGDRSIEAMCDASGIDEDAFYDHFLTEEEIEKAIWAELMLVSLQTVKGDTNYVSFSDQDKLLSLFYTFFENLTLNRAYILINLKERSSLKERLALFKPAKELYLKFIDEVFSGSSLLAMAGKALGKLSELGQKGVQESFWIQCLCIIEFWRKDESQDCERTDIAIEKSVKAACDLIEAAPVRSVLDLGKFIWKERFGSV